MKIWCYNEMNTQPTGLITQSTTHQSSHSLLFQHFFHSDTCCNGMSFSESLLLLQKKKFHNLLKMFLCTHVRSSNPVKTTWVQYHMMITHMHIFAERGTKCYVQPHLHQYTLHTAEPSSCNCLQTHFLYFEKNHRWGLCQNQTEN